MEQTDTKTRTRAAECRVCTVLFSLSDKLPQKSNSSWAGQAASGRARRAHGIWEVFSSGWEAHSGEHHCHWVAESKNCRKLKSLAPFKGRRPEGMGEEGGTVLTKTAGSPKLNRQHPSERSFTWAMLGPLRPPEQEQ